MRRYAHLTKQLVDFCVYLCFIFQQFQKTGEQWLLNKTQQLKTA